MSTSEPPRGHSPDSDDFGDESQGRKPDRSRLEGILTKSSIWKKQTLRDIERNREQEGHEVSDRATKKDKKRAAKKEKKRKAKMARLFAQLVERNDEIERLRQVVAKLENEKSSLDREHQREVALHRAEMQQLQDAYDQFEKESDSLLSELGQQNERLIDECRRQNVRSLLK